MGSPVAIVTPDEKGRLSLRRWLSSIAGARYSVTVEGDEGARRIILEEV